MTLVIPGRVSDVKRRFTITVEKDMFSGTNHPRKIDHGMDSTVTDSNASLGQCDDSGKKLLAITAGIGVVSAVILGYFIGRTRD
jgi:hypothetical protein